MINKNIKTGRRSRAIAAEAEKAKKNVQDQNLSSEHMQITKPLKK